MAEEASQRDRPAIPGCKGREVLGDRRVEGEQALFDQGHEHGGGEQLGERCDVEDGLLAHRDPHPRRKLRPVGILVAKGVAHHDRALVPRCAPRAPRRPGRAAVGSP